MFYLIFSIPMETKGCRFLIRAFLTLTYQWFPSSFSFTPSPFHTIEKLHENAWTPTYFFFFTFLWIPCDIDLLLCLFHLSFSLYWLFLVSFLWKAHPYPSTGDRQPQRFLSFFSVCRMCEGCDSRSTAKLSSSLVYSLKHRYFFCLLHHNSYNLWTVKLWSTA